MRKKLYEDRKKNWAVFSGTGIQDDSVSMVFVLHLTNWRVWHKAFLMWDRALAVVQTRPAFQKNASSPVDIPLKDERLRRQAINLTPLRWVKA